MAGVQTPNTDLIGEVLAACAGRIKNGRQGNENGSHCRIRKDQNIRMWLKCFFFLGNHRDFNFRQQNMGKTRVLIRFDKPLGLEDQGLKVLDCYVFWTSDQAQFKYLVASNNYPIPLSVFGFAGAHLRLKPKEWLENQSFTRILPGCKTTLHTYSKHFL